MKFTQYLLQRQALLCAAALFAALFCASFALYQLPVGAAAYPSALCAGIGAVWLAVDYFRARAKHETLARLPGVPAEALAQSFPAPATLAEADYQAIIRALCEELRAQENAASARQADMADYYAAWTHQIKTPIAAMRLRLQGEDSPLVRRLSSDLFRVEQYAEMVLTYLRLDAGSTDYVFRTYDLDSIVKDAVKKFSSEFIGRKLRLVYAPLHTAVVTDEKWLSFVI